MTPYVASLFLDSFRAPRADAPTTLSNGQGGRPWSKATRPYGVAALGLSGFLRGVTHPRVFNPPSSLTDGLACAHWLRGQPKAGLIAPRPRHWDIFAGLCRAADVKGNLVPEAYLAAPAIESRSAGVTTDRDYSRCPGLNWRHPLEG